MGDHDGCFVDLFDDSLSADELLLVAESLVSGSKILSLHDVLSLKNLSGMA